MNIKHLCRKGEYYFLKHFGVYACVYEYSGLQCKIIYHWDTLKKHFESHCVRVWPL